MQIEEIKPEDEYLSMYGTFIKVKTNGHDRCKENYDILSKKDLDEIADLIEIGNDGQ